MGVAYSSIQRVIYIVRHAKSKRPKAGISDYERPLTKRGASDARDLASKMLESKTWLDSVIASSAVRGRDTAGIVVDKLSVPADRVLYDRRLYGATLQRWMAHLRKLDSKTVRHVMLVGHNPEIELLMRRLSGIDNLRAPPCGALALQYRGTWANLARSAEYAPKLMWSYYPKRDFKMRPEIVMTTNAIVSSARSHMPRSLDWDLCSKVLTDVVREAVCDLYRQHHRMVPNILPAREPEAAKPKAQSSGAAKSGAAKSKPKSSGAAKSGAAKSKPKSSGAAKAKSKVRPASKAKPKPASAASGPAAKTMTTAEKLASSTPSGQ